MTPSRARHCLQLLPWIPALKGLLYMNRGTGRPAWTRPFDDSPEPRALKLFEQLGMN